MKTNLMLCDWAEVIAGKLYMQGGGWSLIRANQPVNFAVALLIHIPYDQTNIQHRATVKLVTEDGKPYPTERPAEVGFGFEIGRPPGMRQGQEQTLPFSAAIGGIELEPGGYRWDVLIDDEPVDGTPFQSILAE